MRKETKERGRRFLMPVVRLLANLGVSPAAVTGFGLLLSICAAILFARGFFLWGGLITGLVGLCDTIDGELSRISGTASSSGAIFDSTIDRFSEGVIFIGISWYYLGINQWSVLITLMALLFSFLVSYVRARAEGTGRECQVGFFERPVRVTILVISAIFLGRRYLPAGVAIIMAGSFATFVQRFLYVLRQKQR
ncbi:MAG: CDP-alcohol phosphatidyltransferase family protein [bacterium]